MTLIFPFAPGSVSPSEFAIAAESRGHDVIFLVNPQDVEARGYLRMLAAFGEVIARDDHELLHWEFPTSVAGVVAFTDERLPFAYALARRLGLIGNDPKISGLVTNKREQRSLLNAAGVGFCPTVNLSPSVPWSSAFDECLPGVLKPAAGAGSRDTYFVDTAEDVVSLLAKFSPGEEFVLERRIEGPGNSPGSDWLADYISVESFIVDGDVSHIGLTGRLPLAEPARERGLVFPFSMTPALDDEARRVAEEAIRALGISHGWTHTEMKFDGAGFIPIEVNARLGGGLASLMPRAGVIDPVGLAIDLALGIQPEPPRPAAAVAAHIYVQPPQTASGYHQGPHPRELRRLPGVYRADASRAPGASLDWRTGSSGRIFDVWLEAPELGVLRTRLDGLDQFLSEHVSYSFQGEPHGSLNAR